MRFRKYKKANVDEENPYWMSFSDMMSALLVVFILASVALILRIHEIEKELEKRKLKFEEEVVELQKAEQVRHSILEEAAKELMDRGIGVEISENHTVLRIPNELLGFETAEHRLQRRYEQTAREIGAVLEDVITKDNRVRYLDTVFVEGHTDIREMRGLLGTGNWGLSTFRAISLWQFWEMDMPENRKLSALRNADERPLFSVSGYAGTRPVSVEQLTEADFQLNRRIDIRFTIRRPNMEEYKQVRDILIDS